MAKNLKSATPSICVMVVFLQQLLLGIYLTRSVSDMKKVKVNKKKFLNKQLIPDWRNNLFSTYLERLKNF
jgi:hypothetical protein